MTSVELTQNSATQRQNNANSNLTIAQRKQNVINQIDKKSFSWVHAKTIAVTGIGFFTEAYDLFVISIAVQLIGYVYYSNANTTLLPGNPYDNNGSSAVKANSVAKLDSSMIKGAALFGTLIGQLVFGYIGDVVGRKKVYGLELGIIIVATAASAMCASANRGISVVGELILWRVIVGIGIGGDYPLSSVMTGEFAATKFRGAMVSAVFAMQGLGQLFGGIVSLIFLQIFSQAIGYDQQNADYVWRFVIGFGCIPGAIAFYFRLTLPESPRYTMHVEGQIDQAEADLRSIDAIDESLATPSSVAVAVAVPVAVHVAADEPPRVSWADFRAHFGKWENFKVLMGCSGAWFFVDIAFYGTALSQGTILTAIGYISSGGTPYANMWNNAVGSTVITLMGTVPGYWFSVALIDRWGRKPIQVMGFSILIVLYIIMASAYPQLLDNGSAVQNTFVFIYVLALFFTQFGPNVTTFVIPGEVFPTRFRSTAHGICAASGKAGAILAQYACYNLASTPTPAQMQQVFAGFAASMVCGLFFTYFIPETKGITLEELGHEDESDTIKAPNTTKEQPDTPPNQQQHQPEMSSSSSSSSSSSVAGNYNPIPKSAKNDEAKESDADHVLFHA